MQERESPELLCCRASSCEEHSNFILSCNLTGQRENKSFYVTEIVFWLGFADVIFGGTSARRKYVCVRRLSLTRYSLITSRNSRTGIHLPKTSFQRLNNSRPSKLEIPNSVTVYDCSKILIPADPLIL